MNSADDSGIRQSWRELIMKAIDQLHEEFKVMERANTESDREWRAEIADLKVSIARLETKVAMYAALASAIGGLFGALIVEFVSKRF